MNQNPVACAGAIVAIQYLADKGLLANSIETGAYLLGRMKELVDEFEIVGNVRGKGLMCGFEFVQDKATKEPFDPTLQVSKRFELECLKRGVVTFMCTGCVEGVAGDMILITPPLVITPEQVDELVGLTKDALGAVQSELVA
jgi:adenosylmethionine-8-amino-7-oxononanoate aminotransferase